MESQDHLHANKHLSKEELLKIEGGAVSITGSLISAISDGVRMIHEIGKSLGSSIIRLRENTFCKIK